MMSCGYSQVFWRALAKSMVPLMKAIMREGLGGCGMGGTIGTSAPLYSNRIIETIFHVSL